MTLKILCDTITGLESDDDDDNEIKWQQTCVVTLAMLSRWYVQAQLTCFCISATASWAYFWISESFGSADTGHPAQILKYKI